MPNDERYRDREAEIQRAAREAALRQFPNPERVGCPDPATLRAIAANSLPFDHPAILHVAQCSPCLQDISRFEAEAKARTRRRIWIGVAAVIILCVGAAIAFFVKRTLRPARNSI